MSSGARAAVEAVERRAREHREHQATEPYFGLARCGKGEVVARHLVCSRVSVSGWRRGCVSCSTTGRT